MDATGIPAWFMDDSDDNQRDEHHRNPPEYVDGEYINKHGILSWKINADDYENDATYKKVKAERGYTFDDEVTISKEKLPNFEEMMKLIFQEHFHEYDEVRLCKEGSGYFDFRDFKDRWVRLRFTKGDLLAVPAGMYHRFTLDYDNYVVARRLFPGEPVWTPHHRPADDNSVRGMYLESIKHLSED